MPLDTGGKIRSYHLARELARNNELDLFIFYPEISPDPHPALDPEFSRVVRMPIKIAGRAGLRDRFNYGLNLFSGRPHSMTKFCRPEVRRRLREHLRAHSYDVVVCDFLLTAAVIPWDIPTPKIVFTHNVEAVIWKRHFEVNKNLLWKAVSWREYRTMDRMERLYLRKADHVLTVSQSDRNAFSEFLQREKMTVIETGVDVDFFRPESTSESPLSMVFTGSMDWMPNEDAILYFVEQILPKIRASYPTATLTVVGRSPSAKLQELAARNQGLKVTGRVEDIRPYIRESAVYVVPLRVGGGTRIKIFEAMAMGKAIVSTSIGAEGLPVQDNEHLLLADTASDFASKVVELFRDPVRRSHIGRSARSLVEANYSWASVARQFDLVLRKLANRGSASAAEIEFEAESIESAR